MRHLRSVFAASFAIALLSSCGGGNGDPQPLEITASSPPAGTTGAAYGGYTFTASGGTGPFSWKESGSLAPGLTLSASGQLSGMPVTAGTYPMSVTVTDSSMPPLTASRAVSLKINDSSIMIAPAMPPSGNVGNPYAGFSYTASGGSPPYSWKVTSGIPPPGLTLGTYGSVSGTPTTIGTFSFSVSATDSAQQPMASPPLAAQITVGPESPFTVLHSFAGPPTDGSIPFGSLVLQGDLFGTAFLGGSLNLGAVFKVSPNGEETVLHNFTGSPTDGSNPAAELISDASGNLYGTTISGGAYGSSNHSDTTLSGGASGSGVVFKLDPTGKESVLYSFTGGSDGGDPLAGLIMDQAGNLYGTTRFGGLGAGVVFKLDLTGKETVLYSFTGGADGLNPYATLVRDGAGNLYGTTLQGGSFNLGVVFKLDSTGTETVLHHFTGGADGASPVAGLIQDPAGNLYGTTPYGGDLSVFQGLGCGVVFKLDPTGKETVLYTFRGGADGCQPRARLVRDPAGNLYGTTDTSGACPLCGVVFKLDMTGKETVLHTFTGPDGRQVDVGLIRDANGDLYGVTEEGGTSDQGVVFKLIP
jgi:uncharacterized repeat protein (TIGR03803 family)